MEAPIFRGAPVNQQERNQLNKLGGQILRDAGLDFEEWKDYHWILNETKDQGYADFYLVKRWNDSKKINEADVTVYQRLIDIDTILGTKLGTQLSQLDDSIGHHKGSKFCSKQSFKIGLDYRL